MPASPFSEVEKCSIVLGSPDRRHVQDVPLYGHVELREVDTLRHQVRALHLIEMPQVHLKRTGTCINVRFIFEIRLEQSKPSEKIL